MTDTNHNDVDVSALEVSDAEVQSYLDGTSELRDILGMNAELVAQLKGRAQFFLDGGHDERALIMLEMLEELDRTDRVPTLLAIETLLKLGLSDRAEEKVTKLLERAPEDPDALVAKAQLELSTGRWHEAARTIKRVVDGDPNAEHEATKRALVLAHAAYERFESSR
ncbi:MAG: tetratricopeptide repeat protein [Myxococcota bacterium]